MLLAVVVLYVKAVPGAVLTAARIFTAIQLLDLVRQPLSRLPMEVTKMLRALVASGRVNSFLDAQEAPERPTPSQQAKATAISNNLAVQLENMVFEWPAPEAEESKEGEKEPEQKAGAAVPSTPSGKKNVAGDADTPASSSVDSQPADDEEHDGAAPHAVFAIGHSSDDEEGEEDDEAPTALLMDSKRKSSTATKLDAAAGDDGASDGGASAGKPGFRLRVPQFHVQRGELVACVGSVGSGKSSLLRALLHQMPVAGDAPTVVAGQEQVSALYGSVAYVAQQPWVMNATLKDNIAFMPPTAQPDDSPDVVVPMTEAAPASASAARGYGEASAEWYARVKSACCLDADIATLPAGDNTEVGERGITLSGGQKARVALARACYSRPDLVIADDVLSAVDAHVGKALFEDVFRGLLSGSTVVMATHHLWCLPHVDRIVVVDGGDIVQQGTVHVHVVVHCMLVSGVTNPSVVCAL